MPGAGILTSRSLESQSGKELKSTSCSHPDIPLEGPWLAPFGHKRGLGRPPHLVRGCLTLLDAHGMLLVVGEHHQANEAAHAEDHLLAREDCIAGAAKEAKAKQRGGSTDNLTTSLSPRKQTHVPTPVGVCAL